MSMQGKKKTDQSAIQKAASQARAMEKYGGKTINNVLLRCPTGQSKPGDGILWQAKCLLCNTDLKETVTVKRLKKGNPCPCQRPDVLRRLKYNTRVGETFGKLTFQGLDGTEDRHMMGIFRCACGEKVVRKRMEEVINGRVTSCGCVQRMQMKSNLVNASSQNIIMGTNLIKISREDTQLYSNNTSGYTGIGLQKTNLWYARLVFQGRTYTTYHHSRDSAIAGRFQLKRIHKDFVSWWKSLTPEQRQSSNAAFELEKAARISLFDQHIANAKELTKKYTAVHLLCVVPGNEDYTLYAYCGDRKIRHVNIKELVFADARYTQLRDPIWFRDHLTVIARAAAWDVRHKDPFASPYIPLDVIYTQGTIVNALPKELESDLRYED